jgi:hypothetical protein
MTSGKDTAISFTIRQIINLKAKKLGAHIKDFHIDSQHKHITATVLLVNDAEPLTLKALGYKITEKNAKHFLEVSEIVKSREWENSYIDGKRYKIPPEILKAAELIL